MTLDHLSWSSHLSSLEPPSFPWRLPTHAEMLIWGGDRVSNASPVPGNGCRLEAAFAGTGGILSAVLEISHLQSNGNLRLLLDPGNPSGLEAGDTAGSRPVVRKRAGGSPSELVIVLGYALAAAGAARRQPFLERAVGTCFLPRTWPFRSVRKSKCAAAGQFDDFWLAGEYLALLRNCLRCRHVLSWFVPSGGRFVYDPPRAFGAGVSFRYSTRRRF